MSIGSECRTRHQIARIQKTRNEKHRQPTMFFDWLMSGGISGVIDIIQRDFKLLPEDFSVDTLTRPANHIPLHKPSGFRFLHDLGCTAESRKSEKAALDAMKKNMDEFLSKYEYIGRRTDEYLRNIKYIGLVYYGNMNKNNIEKLISVLNKKYNRDFEIIQVMEEGKHKPVGLPNITSLTVNNSSVRGTANSWMGSDESWDQAFKEIKTL